MKHEREVRVHCVTGGLGCVGRLRHSPRVPGDGARPGFATWPPAPAHTVPRRESGLSTAGLCCGCHALDRGHGGPALFPAGLLAVVALARGVQISMRRCEDAAVVLTDETAGPAGLSGGSRGRKLCGRGRGSGSRGRKLCGCGRLQQ